MLTHVSLTILAENRAANARYLAEQGLSIFIETSSGNLLFDTGQTDTFIRNAKELNINLSDINGIVLSHGHYDHTGGLPHYLHNFGPVDVYCHPSIANKKYKVYPGGNLDIGVPWETGKMRKSGAHFIYKSHPFKIMTDIWLSGEIPRNCKYELIDEVYQQRILESYIHDELHDDMCLIFNANKGLVVLLGCGHSGVINSIKHASRVTENKNIYAVIGGMHLNHTPEDRIQKIIENLKRLNPEIIIPLHCTGFHAINKMFNHFKDKLRLFNVGDRFSFN